jgi:Pvc16 N-terminal domain
VLRDADRSLASWLSRVLPPGAGLRFEAPDAQWLTRPPEPLFVDVFLHAIREDPRGRQSGWSELRDANGQVTGRQPAPQYYRLGYLITVWSARPGSAESVTDQALAEHEVLGLLLNACAHQPVLPADCLEGTLAGAGHSVALECAPADSQLAGSLWSGLGLRPRAHLELILVAPAIAPVLAELAPPAREIELNALTVPAAVTAASGQAGPGKASFASSRRWQKQRISELPSGTTPPDGGQFK